MSLLGKGGRYEDILIFDEEVVIDRDGNTRTQPATVGRPAKARFQIQGQSGTSARRAEQDNEGYETEQVYKMRLPKGEPIIQAQAQIEWRGKRWSVFGDHHWYNGSRRTQHVEYAVKRF